MSKDTVFKLRLTTDELEAWRKAAGDEKASLSAWIRGLAVEALKPERSVDTLSLPVRSVAAWSTSAYSVDVSVPECKHGIREDYFCFKCGHRIT